MSADTLTESTAGQDPPSGEPWDAYTINMFNYVRNNTASSLTFKWQIIQKSLPFGWFINGFCDNQSCRTSSDPVVASMAQTESYPIEAGDSSQLEPRVAVPTSGDNGVGIIRARVWTDNTSDTAVYIITKSPTGVSTITVNDKRVALYPNPVGDRELIVFTEKSLDPSRIEIYSITGAKQLAAAVNRDKEVTSIDVHSLSAGFYLVRVSDSNGNIITTRKLVRK